jgi:hypothetical protein
MQDLPAGPTLTDIPGADKPKPARARVTVYAISYTPPGGAVVDS